MKDPKFIDVKLEITFGERPGVTPASDDASPPFWGGREGVMMTNHLSNSLHILDSEGLLARWCHTLNSRNRSGGMAARAGDKVPAADKVNVQRAADKKMESGERWR